MKLLKLADRTISVLGLILFGVLTGFSLFLTSYFALTYEEIPHTKGDIFPLVLLICGLLTFLMYRFSGWMLKKEEGQERRIRILAGAVCLYALVFGIWWVGAAKCLPLGDQNSRRRPSSGRAIMRCSPSIPMRNICLFIPISWD